LAQIVLIVPGRNVKATNQWRRSPTTHCSGARNSEPLMLDFLILAMRARPLNSSVRLLLPQEQPNSLSLFIVASNGRYSFNVRLCKKIELFSGIAAGLSGLTLGLIFWGERHSDDVFILVAAPGLLVAAGSYVHVKIGDSIGIGLLVWGGAIYTLTFFLCFSGFAFVFQAWVFAIIGVSLLGMVSLFAALWD
jgi:hypothetical protein